MSVPAYERLLDLIIALTQTRFALTRAQIRSSVNGYTPDDGDPKVTVAFERMFERDKETLKDLGVPLVTVHGSGHHDDIRYRIDLDEYALPDIDLTPAELGVLSVASRLWEGSVLSRQARRGLTKLQGVTTEVEEPGIGPTVHLHEPDGALPDLFDALTARRPVQFEYSAASSGRSAIRTVEPWRLSVKNQGWYLRGWDKGRQAPREFRLSRITSGVRTLQEAFIGPSPDEGEEEHSATTARVALIPDSAQWLRSRGEHSGVWNGRDVYAFEVHDLLSFAGEIAGYGDRAVVLEPPELRDRVIDKLRGALRVGEGRLE